jgi:predicted DNA-binding transcriptional regulator AlpA
MRTELEEGDLQAIAQRVSEILKPMLTHHSGSNEKDTIFDVKGLSSYLHVNPCWVYKQISLKAIPYFKAGKFPRFRKREIDKWIDSKAVREIPALRVIKARGFST